MKILMIGRGIPTKEYPQNGIFEYDQAKALSKAGVEIVYLAVDIRSFRKKRKWGLQQLKREGIECYALNIPLGPLPFRIRLFVSEKALLYGYMKIFQEKKWPDIIHSHFLSVGYISAALKKKTGIPLVITEHSSDMNKADITPDLLRYGSAAYSNADMVIAVSRALCEHISPLTEQKIRIINNVVDSELFMACRKSKHNGFGFITASNLTQIKRIPMLIRAFSEIHKKYADTYLGIIGDGEQGGVLRQYVSNLGMDHAVRFYGRKLRSEIAALYGRYDCFAMVSESETFGVAYIEAIAAGIPVIATDCGGPSEFINQDNGMLIPLDGFDELVQAMEKMYYNAKNYNAEKMRQFVKKKFSAESIAGQLIQIYKEILGFPIESIKKMQ